MSDQRDNGRALLSKAVRVYTRLSADDPRYLDVVRRVEGAMQMAGDIEAGHTDAERAELASVLQGTADVLAARDEVEAEDDEDPPLGPISSW